MSRAKLILDSLNELRKINKDSMIKLFDAIKTSKLDPDKLKVVLKKSGFNMDDFVATAIDLFRAGVISWDNIDFLENDIPPGDDFVPLSWLKRKILSDSSLKDKIPTGYLDKLNI